MGWLRPAFFIMDTEQPAGERTELEPLDDSLVDPPHSYADRPWWHRPTEGERITDGFEILMEKADD